MTTTSAALQAPFQTALLVQKTLFEHAQQIGQLALEAWTENLEVAAVQTGALAQAKTAEAFQGLLPQGLQALKDQQEKAVETIQSVWALNTATAQSLAHLVHTGTHELSDAAKAAPSARNKARR